MAVIKFRAKVDADAFLETYNGRQFTPMEVRSDGIHLDSIDATDSARNMSRRTCIISTNQYVGCL